MASQFTTTKFPRQRLADGFRTTRNASREGVRGDIDGLSRPGIGSNEITAR